jgi:hypothetical protein
MNFTIAKTSKLVRGNRPVHLRPLRVLLNNLGVEAGRGHKRWCDRNLKQFESGQQNDFTALWDKYEQAKETYLNRIRTEHPDRGGSHERCAYLNSVWSTIKLRFAAKQIGVQ